MLATRLWMGTILVLLTVGMLVLDQYLAPWFPFLFVFVLGLSFLACRELLGLLDVQRPAQNLVAYVGVLGLGLANWLPHFPPLAGRVEPLGLLLAVLAFVVLLSFCWEMRTFAEPGHSVERMARTVWLVAYLGVLPCFLAQQRWFFPTSRPEMGTAALALTIFSAKCCDIGAYLTGRLVGKHRMTPVLSPKKTWEGAAGGLTFAMLTAVGLDRLGPVPLLRANLALELGFGFTVGAAGMLGDLAESLIKRDFQRKDASAVVPGFGGVLDVVDALLFAAPVAYLWFWILNRPLAV